MPDSAALSPADYPLQNMQSLISTEELKFLIAESDAVAVSATGLHIPNTRLNYFHFGLELLKCIDPNADVQDRENYETLVFLDGFATDGERVLEMGLKGTKIKIFAHTPEGMDARSRKSRHRGKQHIAIFPLPADTEYKSKAERLAWLKDTVNAADIDYEVMGEPIVREGAMMIGSKAKNLAATVDSKWHSTPASLSANILRGIGALEDHAEKIAERHAPWLAPALSMLSGFAHEKQPYLIRAGRIDSTNSTGMFEAMLDALMIRHDIDPVIDDFLNSIPHAVSPGRDRDLFAVLLKRNALAWEQFAKHAKTITDMGTLTVGMLALRQMAPPGTSDTILSTLAAFKGHVAAAHGGDMLEAMRHIYATTPTAPQSPENPRPILPLAAAALGAAALIAAGIMLNNSDERANKRPAP